MIHHDLTDWPLAITIESGTTMPAELAACLAEWGRWLVRGERFASLRVLTDCDAVASAERAGDDMRRWLRQQGGRMKRQLLGMALVVPAMQLTRGCGLDLERLLEVPAQSFSDIDPAMDWLEWFIAPPHDGQSWGRAAIRARLGMV